MPARDELELSWRNLKPTTTSNVVGPYRPTVSTNYQTLGSYNDTEVDLGVNKNSSPIGAPYTAASPAQTTSATFRTGGAEAYLFGSSYYWSSSEGTLGSAWVHYYDNTNPGYQRADPKITNYRVRAVRRSII